MPQYPPSNLIQIKKSFSGLGAFTKERIFKGDFIIEYTGEKITKDECEKRNSKYLFELNRNTYVDGSGRKNLARYINHSCKPNCEVKIKHGKILIFASQNINTGEELNYDYGEEYFNDFIKPYGCRCAKCRK